METEIAAKNHAVVDTSSKIENSLNLPIFQTAFCYDFMYKLHQSLEIGYFSSIETFESSFTIDSIESRRKNGGVIKILRDFLITMLDILEEELGVPTKGSEKLQWDRRLRGLIPLLSPSYIKTSPFQHDLHQFFDLTPQDRINVLYALCKKTLDSDYFHSLATNHRPVLRTRCLGRCPENSHYYVFDWSTRLYVCNKFSEWRFIECAQRPEEYTRLIDSLGSHQVRDYRALASAIINKISNVEARRAEDAENNQMVRPTDPVHRALYNLGLPIEQALSLGGLDRTRTRTSQTSKMQVPTTSARGRSAISKLEQFKMTLGISSLKKPKTTVTRRQKRTSEESRIATQNSDSGSKQENAQDGRKVPRSQLSFSGSSSTPCT